MDEMKQFYVYEWYIVDTGEIFYVGKGSGKRAISMKDRNKYFKNIRKKHECNYRIIRYFDDENAAYDFEREYGLILKSRGEARACYVLGNFSRFIDESVIRKMKPTQIKKGSVPWNHGVKMNEEFRSKCKARQIGKKQSIETRQKRSDALMNHSVSKEVRQRIAEARKTPIEVTDVLQQEKRIYSCISDFAAECNVCQSAITRVLKSGKIYRKRYIIKHADPESV